MVTEDKWVERFDAEIAKFSECKLDHVNTQGYELEQFDVVHMTFTYRDLIELRMMAKAFSEMESHI